MQYAGTLLETQSQSHTFFMHIPPGGVKKTPIFGFMKNSDWVLLNFVVEISTAA